MRKNWIFPIILAFLLILTGCQKNLAPLKIDCTPAENGFLFSAYGDGLEIANLLYTATGGSLFSESGQENAGAVTVPGGSAALWVPEEIPRDTNVQIAVTAFDQQGRQLSAQTVSLNQIDGVWNVTENELVTKNHNLPNFSLNSVISKRKWLVSSRYCRSS